jgi:CheY-like chemotaxis protein
MVEAAPSSHEATRLILVVEDDEGNREALRDLLSGEGYEVVTAEDGDEALEWLHISEPPDLILLDMMMPVMDGTEFRQRQREDPRLRDIPVVLMSAGSHLEDEACALGVAAVIAKPPDVDEMLRAVARAVDRTPSRRAGE